MGQVNFTISLVMIALFTFSLIMFMSGFSNDNNTVLSINNDSRFNTANDTLYEDIGNFNSESNESISTMIETTLDAGDTSATSGGQAKVTVGSLINMSTTSITLAFGSIFGNDSSFGILLTSLLAVIGLIFGLYVWKTVRGGDPN